MDRRSFIRLSGAILGAATAGMTPALAQALLNADDKAWAEFVKIAKIEPQG